MKTIFQNKLFNAGFLAGICLFSLLNFFSYWSYHTHQLFHKFGPFSIYDASAYGIPFSFYILSDGVPRWSSFYWSELVADVVIAFVISLLIGFAVKTIVPKLKTRLK